MKEEHTYVLMWNDVDTKNGIFDPYENIKGTSPMDALKKRFGKSFKMVGMDERNPDIILRKGEYVPEKKTIYLWGNGAQYCYVCK